MIKNILSLLLLFGMLLWGVSAFAQNNALDFDGVNEYVVIPDHADLRLTNSFTIELWFRAGSLSQSNKYLLNKGNYYALIFEYVNNTVEFHSTIGTPRPGTQILIPDTDYHHIAYSYDGTTWSAYMDGVQVLSEARAFTLDVSTGAPLHLGAADATIAYTNGLLDEVRIWNVGRSAIEIRENMHTTLVGNESGLVAYYQFNHSSGVFLSDVTGHGHDGSIGNIEDVDWVTSTFPLHAGTTVNSVLNTTW